MGFGSTGKPYSRRMAFANTFFVSIASILGTGILGLPVKLARCGFGPFVLTFLGCFVAQLCVVWLMTDLLQRSHALMDSAAFSDEVVVGLGLRAHGDADADADTDATTATEVGNASKLPDLGRMCHQFIDRPWQRRLFDASVLLQFGSILVSYSLAGPAAYAGLLGDSINETLLVPIFVIGFATVIVRCGARVQPVVACLTFCKCLLLVLTVAVLGIAAKRLHVTPNTEWPAFAQPLLIGTVALGGIANIMPVMYSRVPKTVEGIRDFRRALFFGVGFCFLLNALWCFFVLQVVPQTSAAAEARWPSSAAAQGASEGHGDAVPTSLLWAEAEGVMSTVAVLRVLRDRAPGLQWIEDVINSFNIVSITVSFFTWGSGLVHTLDGVAARSLAALRHGNREQQQHELAGDNSAGSSPGFTRQNSSRSFAVLRLLSRPHLLRALGFGAVLILAVANPKGFVVVMERFTSLALNLEAGVFIALMHGIATHGSGSRIVQASVLPLPLEDVTAARLRTCVAWSFGMAIAYDLFEMVSNMLGGFWNAILAVVLLAASVGAVRFWRRRSGAAAHLGQGAVATRSGATTSRAQKSRGGYDGVEMRAQMADENQEAGAIVPASSLQGAL